MRNIFKGYTFKIVERVRCNQMDDGLSCHINHCYEVVHCMLEVPRQNGHEMLFYIFTKSLLETLFKVNKSTCMLLCRELMQQLVKDS